MPTKRSFRTLLRILTPAAWVLLCARPATAQAQIEHRHGDLAPHVHADPAKLRTWTNQRSGESVRGAFLAARDGKVSVEREHGGLVVIALSDLTDADRAEAECRIAEVVARNDQLVATTLSRAAARQDAAAARPTQAAPFEAFAPQVRTRWDARWLYVESDGLPHAPWTYPLMVGIQSWQQQVPLPQAYTGGNAWRIPLRPVLAEKPISGRTALYRGAIALAANGVPIFNALNNRGADAFQVGELDEYGGHAGRADDYHYHIAPLALQKVVGKGKPIAYALDGFPLYGLFAPTAKPGDEKACPLGGTAKLDELNGHFGAGAGGERGLYHYHASTAYPYLNGGVAGVVTVVDDQIEPQPRARPVRPWLQPLRGAGITGFRTLGPSSWSLEYTLGGKKHLVNFRSEAGDKHVFEFVAPDGTKKVETYTSRAAEPPRRGNQDQSRGPAEGAPPAPWVVVHAKEIDANSDGVVAREELLDQARQAFTAYDLNRNGVLEPEEHAQEKGARPPRLPMGGFVQLHAKELDGNQDGNITRDEFLAVAGRIFDKSDRNHDGKLADAELDATERTREEPAAQDPGAGGTRARGARDVLEQMNAFHTDVPVHPLDVVLVRPTPTSVTVSVVQNADSEAWVEFGASPSALDARTAAQQTKRGATACFVLDGLRPDQAYSYRLRYRSAEEKVTPAAVESSREVAASPTYSFHTPRAASAAFTFTVQADSHLDANVTPGVYLRTLANALADRPDFHVDLGDTFMTDKRRDHKTALPQYDAQRYYFGQLCHSAPLFMALGNHDGEYGYAGSGPDSVASWSYEQRVQRFPPPEIAAGAPGMYSGRTAWRHGAGANYYAFTWGDALLVVLDPFSNTRERPRGGGGPVAEFINTDRNWTRTLGREQYDWLERTLASSKAKYKFVFLHHLVGGLGQAARGGVEAAPFFEWGGKNADGSDGFADHRPGWPLPIHRLLVKHGVAAVFHGHDHLYVRSELDGVVYQCVPQPGNARGGTRSAEEYGYKSGTILGSPGHLRVGITPRGAEVAFIRASLAEASHSRRGEDEPNGTVVAKYTIAPRRQD